MIGALWTGISGLSSQQQALDNESNNIANVNTIGFKASRISLKISAPKYEEKTQVQNIANRIIRKKVHDV